MDTSVGKFARRSVH